jgi:hypothetical protein
MSLDATLTDERVLTAGTGIAIVDSGANAPVTLSVDATLAEILVNGNLTGGTDILVSTGDSIIGVTDLVLDPGGGGGDNVIIDGLTWPSADGAVGQALITDSFGILSFGNPTASLTVQDEGITFETTPTTFNFIGSGVTAATGGAGIVDVTIPGGGGALTLQDAYENGNTIVTSTTFGDLDVSGTEAISLDAQSASNFTVDSASLVISTTTSGELDLTSAGLMDVNAGAALDVDVTGTMDFLSTGAFSIDGTGASNVTATSGILTLSTLTSGDLDITSADAVNITAGDEGAAQGNPVLIFAGDGGGANDGGDVSLVGGDSGLGATGDGGDVLLTGGPAISTNGDGGNTTLTTGAGAGAGSAGTVALTGPNDEDEALVTLTTTGTSGDSVQMFVGDNDPDGSVTGLAGSLFFRDTGTGGELYINESTGSGTTWGQVVTSGTDAAAVLTWGNNSVGSSTASRVLDPGYESRTAPLASGTAFIELRVPRAGTLRNLYIYHNNPGGTGAVITYTVFVNGIATAITAGLASTAGSTADTTNSVVVAAGDRVRIQVTKVASAGGGSRRPEVTVEVAA